MKTFILLCDQVVTAVSNLSFSRFDFGIVFVVIIFSGTVNGSPNPSSADKCVNLGWELFESPVSPKATHLSSWDQSISL